ncbi:hypothetical protein AB1Y20_006335 [Prymnesium parvum]|uniref:RING-type domain-containing protein n=1 Tax=Prymnesium parvum TaxID=97485 RepID=A0AB34J3P0_PRYPA
MVGDLSIGAASAFPLPFRSPFPSARPYGRPARASAASWSAMMLIDCLLCRCCGNCKEEEGTNPSESLLASQCAAHPSDHGVPLALSPLFSPLESGTIPSQAPASRAPPLASAATPAAASPHADVSSANPAAPPAAAPSAAPPSAAASTRESTPKSSPMISTSPVPVGQWEGADKVDLFRLNASSDATTVVDSLDAYNMLLKGGFDPSAVRTTTDGVEVHPTDLNMDTCPICTEDLILGPQELVRRLHIPPGETPRHFECGHALHSDCYTIYVCSSGHACPVCAVDARPAPSFSPFEHQRGDDDDEGDGRRRGRRSRRRRHMQPSLVEAEAPPRHAAAASEAEAECACEGGRGVELSRVAALAAGAAIGREAERGEAGGEAAGAGGEAAEAARCGARGVAGAGGRLGGASAGVRGGEPQREEGGEDGGGDVREEGEEGGEGGGGEGGEENEGEGGEEGEEDDASDVGSEAERQAAEQEEEELLMALQVSLSEYHQRPQQS